MKNKIAVVVALLASGCFEETNPAKEPVPCTDECMSSNQCNQEGLCLTSGEKPNCQCYTDDETCSQTWLCYYTGRCSFSPSSGVCELQTSQDCIASKYCADHGLCELSMDRCVPVGNLDCMNSKDCHDKGCCTLDQSGLYCHTSDQLSCDQSSLCNNGTGFCSYEQVQGGGYGCCNTAGLCMSCHDPWLKH